jgi:hypothetical protein
LALVEIEETNDRPKTVLGDAFAILFGDGISFKGNTIDVGEYTTLIILGHRFQDHSGRVAHFSRKINSMKSMLATNNAKIGEIKISTYSDGSNLTELLDDLITLAINKKV